MRFSRSVAIMLLVFAIVVALWSYLDGDRSSTGEQPSPYGSTRAARDIEPVMTVAPEPVEDSPETGPIGSIPAPPVPQGVGIAGTVVDGSGEPVPAAVVAAYQAEKGAIRTATDEYGHFMFDGIEPGEYRLSAKKTGFNEAVLDAVSAGAHDVVIKLENLSSVKGRVVSAQTGGPITQFDITCLEITPDTRTFWQQRVHSPQTQWTAVDNPRGEFSLDGVVSARVFAIGVRAEGYEPEFVKAGPIDPGSAADDVVISLAAEGRVRGLVTAASGGAVSGAQILLGDDPEGQVLAETDADGRFELSGLGPDEVMITAAHPEYLPVSVPIAADNGQTVDVEIVLGEGGIVEGTVRLGGNPSADQAVSAGRIGVFQRGKEVRTDSDGYYRITGLPLGPVEVMARLDPDSNTEGPSSTLMSRAIVAAGQPTIVDFAFPEAYCSIEGAVTLDGLPCADAIITGTIVGEGGDSFFKASSGPDGFYRADGLMPGSAWLQVTVDAGSGERRKNVPAELRPAETARVDVAFDAGVSLFGALANLGEGEIAEVAVIAGDPRIDPGDIQSLLELQAQAVGNARLGDDGTYRVDNIEPGDYTILAITFNPDSGTDGAIAGMRISTARVIVADDAAEDVQIDLAF